MIENKFVLLVITSLWLTGGFGTVLSLLYMVQYRRRHWWSIGNTVSVPRTLAPLYGSLFLFCSGIALYIYTTQAAIALWVTLLWGGMALLFAIQGVLVMAHTFEEGWDTPLVSDADDEGGLSSAAISALAALLLLGNVGLLGWWGATQVDSSAFDSAMLWRQSSGVPTTATVAAVATPATADTPPSLVPFVALSTTAAITLSMPVVTIEPTLSAAAAEIESGLLAGSAPAIVTVAPPALHVTPSAPTLGGPVGLTATVALSAEVPFTVSQVTEEMSTIVTSTVALPTVEVSTTLTPPPIALALTVRSQQGVNLRSAPSLRSTVLTVLRNGQAATAMGRTTKGEWLFIQLANGSQGWISTPLTVVDGTVSTLPVKE